MPPERLAELVERYRSLGIERSNPLNEVTERTRAALERHARAARADRDEALAPADRGGGGPRRRDRRRHGARARPGAALLRALDRRLPGPARGGARRPGAARLRRQLGGRAWPRRLLGGAGPRGGARSRRLHCALAAREGARARRPLRGGAADDGPADRRRRGPGRRRVLARVPIGLADGRALARPRHPRAPRRARGARRPARRPLPGRLRRRPPRDPLGTSTRWPRPARASSASSWSGSGCRRTTPRSSPCSRGLRGGRWLYPRQGEAGCDQRRAREPPLPGPRPADPHAGGARRRAAEVARAGGRGADGRLARGRAGRGRRARRPERLRQDDAAEADRRNRPSSEGRSRPSAASRRCSSSAPASTPSHRAATST